MSYVGTAIQKVEIQGAGSGSNGADNPLMVSGNGAVVAGEITRPADTNAYGANDMISTNTTAGSGFTFADVVVVNAGKGVITQAKLVLDETSVISGMSGFRIHLFETAQSYNDNDARNHAYADLAAVTHHGFIDFATPEDVGACLVSLATGLNLIFKTGAATRNLYGMLITKGAYTPGSGKKFTVTLSIANL